MFDAAISIGDKESANAIGEEIIAERSALLESGCTSALDTSILLGEAGPILEHESDGFYAFCGRELSRIAGEVRADMRNLEDVKKLRGVLAVLDRCKGIEPAILAAIRTALRWLSRPVLVPTRPAA